ncbi:MAG: glycine cleavage system aminomethyltransferase GcvT [Oscillatoriales cyanobacterium C42_A2020_001]|nr:glycine cleavage system aminomethyltransferase GcvT [Leptolyngbyaceae cyanobacterium C42_A2020_001]
MTESSHSSSSLARTPLYRASKNLNARMTEFSGWEMPVQYSGITREHQAVRTAAGMFDISHMGKFRFVGKTVLEQLQRLVPSDLSRLQPGEAQYTVLLNHNAGIIDDLIFYNQGFDAEGNQRWVAIVNAATTHKDKTWLLDHLDIHQLEFCDDSRDTVLIAVQGPAAVEQLENVIDADLSDVKAFGHLEGTVLGQPGFLARTGYTGEDGFEIMVAPDTGIKLWEALLQEGVIPCGLGARDTLRLEAAMALYGQDIDDSTTPLEAGLGWLVHLDSKGDFIGRSILEQQKQAGVKRRLVGLQMQGRNIARHGYPVLHEGKTVGVVTSGTLSPTLGIAIALAYVPVELSKPGQAVEVEIRGKSFAGEIVKKPFYRCQKS